MFYQFKKLKMKKYSISELTIFNKIVTCSPK